MRKISCKKYCFCILLWNLTLTLIENPQNISVDQIITELSTLFHYELVMNFSWNPKDFHNRNELYIAWWNRTQKEVNNPLCYLVPLVNICKIVSHPQTASNVYTNYQVFASGWFLLGFALVLGFIELVFSAVSLVQVAFGCRLDWLRLNRICLVVLIWGW